MMRGLRMKSHEQHDGERFVQRMRNTPSEVSSYVPQIVESDMPAQHAEFFKNLPYLPLGTLDSSGYLWATILCNPATTILSNNTLQIIAKLPAGDPFGRAVLSEVSGPRYFAGVGVDFTNRRRNKLAGTIKSATVSEDNVLNIVLVTNENLGNCPKYITVRKLQSTVRHSQTIIQDTTTLRDEAIAVLRQASTIFIASKHIVDREGESDLGFNHRGGPKGFVRYFESSEGRGHLVIPDYSGNRFYQSLGNVQSDGAIGMVVPDFGAGHLLHVHGKARNVFDAEAEAIMPGCTLLTEVAIEQSVLVQNSMNMKLVGEETTSPYNPKLRLLANEQSADHQAVELVAHLLSVVCESKRVSTFTFQLPERVEMDPGGHAVFDFSHLVSMTYQHMNNQNPRSLNDDYLRTWTVSKVSLDKTQISVTVKKAGLISSFLHSLGDASDSSLEVVVRGVGGSFSCFEGTRLKTPRMLWVAAGVGITPFLAMYRGLQNNSHDYNIDLLYSCRGDEVALIKSMNLGSIRIRVFDSSETSERHDNILYSVTPRRLRQDDFEHIADISDRVAYLCGPVGFMADVRGWLHSHLSPEHVLFEKFDF